MSSEAVIVLKESLKAAQAAHAEAAAGHKRTIDEGRRAQGYVDAAARKVEDLQRAVSTLERIEREGQHEVDDE